MIVCGIELAASEARLVLLSGSKTAYTHLKASPPKLVLTDDNNPDEVRAFRNALYAFFRENNVGLVAIKRRGKRGEFSGGPVSFKLEGIIQLFTDADVMLIAPPTISAAKRKHSPNLPSDLRKYQNVAFETAFAVLP